MVNSISFNDFKKEGIKSKFNLSFYSADFSGERLTATVVFFAEEKLEKLNEYILALINNFFVSAEHFRIKIYFTYADDEFVSLLIKTPDTTVSLNYDMTNALIMYPKLVLKKRQLTKHLIKKHIKRINKNFEPDLNTISLSEKSIKIYVRDKKINEEICVKIPQKT